MLVLHHYSPRHVSADLRVACETFAQILSLHVEAKVQAETSVLRVGSTRRARTLVGRLTRRRRHRRGARLLGSAALSRGDAAPSVYLEGHLHLVGETPAAAEILALVEWLNGSQPAAVCAPNICSREYPPAAKFAAVASGLLAVGLSRVPRDYVLWFRPEIGRTVRWAGDPSKPTKVDRHGARLTPRGSFAEWLEVTRMQSAPWSEVDLEAAEALRVVLLETRAEERGSGAARTRRSRRHAPWPRSSNGAWRSAPSSCARWPPIWRRPRSASGARSRATCTTIWARRSPPRASAWPALCRRRAQRCPRTGERGRRADRSRQQLRSARWRRSSRRTCCTSWDSSRGARMAGRGDRTNLRLKVAVVDDGLPSRWRRKPDPSCTGRCANC